jgi:hypothetical protein
VGVGPCVCVCVGVGRGHGGVAGGVGALYAGSGGAVNDSTRRGCSTTRRHLGALLSLASLPLPMPLPLILPLILGQLLLVPSPLLGGGRGQQPRVSQDVCLGEEAWGALQEEGEAGGQVLGGGGAVGVIVVVVGGGVADVGSRWRVCA